MRDLDVSILELVQGDAVTPDEVAKQLGISWATANGHLLKLVGEGKVFLIRKGRVNVYRAVAPSNLEFQVPRLVRHRSLEELSEELADYFPRNVTAAELVLRERRNA